MGFEGRDAVDTVEGKKEKGRKDWRLCIIYNVTEKIYGYANITEEIYGYANITEEVKGQAWNRLEWKWREPM